MKILLFFTLCFFVTVTQSADSVTVNLDRVTVLELAQFIYADITKQNFVLDSTIIDNKERITVHLQDMEKSRISSVLEDVLDSAGIEVEKKGKVVFLRVKPEKEKKIEELEDELFFYRPKYRSVSYISDISASLFKKGRFSFQRQVKQAVPMMAAPTSSGGVNSSPSSPAVKPQDSGNSALSNLDKDHDAFIFTGPLPEIEKLKKLLVQIDQPGGEIVVKGMVYEVSTSSSDGSAIGLALNLLDGKVGITAGVAKTLGNAVTLSNKGTFAIDAIYSALSTDTRFKVISSPMLRVRSGGVGRLSAGSDVPVLGAIQTTATGISTQSVEYKPSGVIFSISPDIHQDQIDLNVTQQISSFSITTTGVNGSPTLSKREITSSISAGNDDVIVLGGLSEEKSSDDRNGLSFLPSWLHSSGRQSTKTEVLLILQVSKI